MGEVCSRGMLGFSWNQISSPIMEVLAPVTEREFSKQFPSGKKHMKIFGSCETLRMNLDLMFFVVG